MKILAASVVCDGLPPDAEVAELSYRDAISEVFQATVVIATADAQLDLAALLHTAMAVSLTFPAGELTDDRGLCVHGLIESASYLSGGRHHHLYRFVLRPNLQGLAHRVRTRHFMGENAVQIVKRVFKEAGIAKESVVWEMTDEEVDKICPVRELCVQYKESELAFVSRLLEDEGIFYWFEHTPEGHVCHLAHNQAKVQAIVGDPALPASEELHTGQETISELVLSLAVTPDAYATREWFFERPDKPVEASVDLAEKPTLELYEYPGGLVTPESADVRAASRSQALAVPARVLRAVSNCPRLAAGRVFLVAGASPPGFDGDYLLLSVEHVFEAPTTFSSETEHGGVSLYRCHLEAIPAATAFRPARTTPVPRVWGLESAVVTTPPGEEIHVDELGRIKVHFYWDREHKVDDQASPFIRVQQQNTSGSMLLPRVGWEMSIGFLDGNPDRPVALQKMYNRETMPPYGMPDNKTQSALQSATSPGGGSTNEVRLQDGAGGMEFFIHSSKDFYLQAGNDLTETITVNAHEEVGLALHTEVGTDEQVTVASTHGLNVTGDASDDTIAAKTEAVGAMDDWGITKDLSITTGGNRKESIGGLMNVLANQVVETYNADYQRTAGAVISMATASSLMDAVAGSKTETVGAAKMELIAKAKAEDIKGSKTLTSGLVHETTGKDIGVSASSAMTVTVGGPIAEKVGDAYMLAGGAVLVTSPGGADFKVGGTKISAKAGKLAIKASSVGAAGGPAVKIKGRIDYKD